MKRESIFRGKSIKEGIWLSGYLIMICQETCPALAIGKDSFHLKGVKPETVGEYTGRKDKNGKKIYDGDIIESTVGNLEIVWGEIKGRLKGFPRHCDEFEMMGWCVKSKRLGLQPLDDSFYNEHEIKGNIHDNPELIK